MNSRRKFLTTMGGAAVAPVFVRPARQKPRPNIVFILADDLGWGDLHCYGHNQVKTPHIDRLAAEGVLFTQFYTASPVCSPSDSNLLPNSRAIGN